MTKFAVDHDVRTIHIVPTGEPHVLEVCQPAPRKQKGMDDLQEVELVIEDSEVVGRLEEDMYNPCKQCRERWLAAFGKVQRRVLYTRCVVCTTYAWCIEPGLGFMCAQCLQATVNELKVLE